ncbi:MAG: hypothetical protein JXM73_23335 [Anaerolineae bacterium]|nr:hypothetical protein [Anaerolineae bacterium]
MFTIWALLMVMPLGLPARLSDQHQPTGWQIVGQVGGPTSAVAVQGDYAYVGVGLRLVVLDVTDPAMPTEAGATIPFPYYVEAIALCGTRAYVAAGGAGLRVVDVSDPATPTEVGAWDSPGYAEGVAVVGNHAYLADGPYGLWVVDVSNPADPALVGSAYDTNYAFDVVVSGNYVYVAAAGAGLLVADVSDPAQPVEAGQVDTPGYAYGVAVSGSTAYVTDAWAGMHAIDVSAPATPGLLGTCATPGWALDVAVEGDTAYVAAGAGGLRVVDVSDPAHPQEKGALVEGGLARRIALAGSTAYQADLTDGLYLIDVMVPEEPSETGRYSPLVEARYLAVAGPYAYVAAGFSGLRVVDISDPAHPRELAAYETGTYATGVVVSGTVAYVPTYLSGVDPHDLHIVDISNPLHPVRLSTVDTDGVFRGVAVQGQYLYAADEAGLRIIDVADPSSPQEAGFVRLSFVAQAHTCTIDVAVSGQVAYVANSYGGLAIVDVSDPTQPDWVGTYLPATWLGVAGVAVIDQVAFLATDFDGLRTVDVSDPASPIELGSYDSPGYAVSVSVVGDEAILSDGGGGIQVLNISDPTAPSLVDSYNTSGLAWHAAMAAGYLHVADSRGGLVILKRVDRQTLASLPAPPGLHSVMDPSVVAAGRPPIPGRTATPLLASCVVSSAADSGPGALRWCIDNALGGDTITFDPLVFDPMNPVTITLLSSLPPLTQGSVTIDASEAGVILDGSGTPAGSSGLMVESDSNAIKGLQVVGFPGSGISISGEARYNQIGGSRSRGSGPLGQGNLLSGNGDAGLSIGGTGAMSNTVLGNLIGTDAGGTELVGNGNGVTIGSGASHNTIGGDNLGEANVIAGNLDNEIAIWGAGTSHNVLTGNLIGTDPSGTAMLGPCPAPGAWTTGIHLHSGAGQNVIGPGNVINATLNAGVQLFGDGTDQNVVTGNLIGTDITGSQPLGNLGHGIVFSTGPQHNAVGPGNQVAHSSWSGVLVQGVTTLYNTITANGIHDNGGQGIELADGGNGAISAPSIESADRFMVVGTAEPGAIVEIFSGADDEGQNYEGETVADPSGSFTFSVPLGMAGQTATATATDTAGNTSAFSAPYILYSTTLTVTSPLDSGPGTLRQALLDASGGDNITFDPGVFDPQNPLTITLLTDLPPLDQGQVIIDASEAGVILDGQRIADNFCGLRIASDSNTVRGLQFVGFNNSALCVDHRYNVIGGTRDQGRAPTGQGNQFGANNEAISLWGDENTILGNLIGTDVSGGEAMSNTIGIGIVGAGNHIGGPTPGERNIISANTFRGIQILGESARYNVVAGNYIGTDITGQHALGNYQVGVIMEVQASDNVIGGTTSAERNLISGNLRTGVAISDAGSTHNTVIGNWIGTDASGTRALGNNPGIHINHCGFNRIGGTEPGEGNVISGNLGSAIALAGYEYTDNLILGNLIGVTPDGSQPLGNGAGIGLHVNTRRTFVGGATAGERNLIADNDIGVHASVAGTEHNWILGNSIGTDATGKMQWGNHQTGIVVEEYAAHTMVQGNIIAHNGDEGYGQTAGVYISGAVHHTLRRNSIHSNLGLGIHLAEGGNNLLPAPVILTVTETTVSGTACPGCVVEIFSDDEDEGRIYEGSAIANTSGIFAFDKGSPLNGPHVTATATDGEGNTSEFSPPWHAQTRIFLPLVLKSPSTDCRN